MTDIFFRVGPVTIGFEAGTLTVGEDVGTIRVAVTLQQDVAVPVTVGIVAVSGSAVEGQGQYCL